MSARDEPYSRLNVLRAVLLNQHDTRRVVRALPGLLDAVFEPMDRFRQAFVSNLFDEAGDHGAA
jgi:hypothetical protein